jgi:hypothetical protein
VNQYNEIRVDFIPYKPFTNTTPREENIDLRYRQDNSVAEKNCTAEKVLTKWSWTNISLLIEHIMF